MNAAKNKPSFRNFFEKFSKNVTKKAGSPYAFIIAVLAVITWALTGPFFNYSNTWQLIINTSTTIITFLMVFIIQQSQNKESIALQLKLDELISTNKYTNNRLVNAENLSEEELKEMAQYYLNFAKQNNNDADLKAVQPKNTAEKSENTPINQENKS